VFLDFSWTWANLTHPNLRTRRVDQPEDDADENDDDVGPTRRRTALDVDVDNTNNVDSQGDNDDETSC
jgi:hypothetical protein